MSEEQTPVKAAGPDGFMTAHLLKRGCPRLLKQSRAEKEIQDTLKASRQRQYSRIVGMAPHEAKRMKLTFSNGERRRSPAQSVDEHRVVRLKSKLAADPQMRTTQFTSIDNGSPFKKGNNMAQSQFVDENDGLSPIATPHNRMGGSGQLFHPGSGLSEQQVLFVSQ